jgi:cytoskeletal protein CcmA (bactofilin family)
MRGDFTLPARGRFATLAHRFPRRTRMFRRKKDNEDDGRSPAPESAQPILDPQRVPGRPIASSSAQPPAAPAASAPAALSPRAPMPIAAARPAASAPLAPRPPAASENEGKKLIVGRDIILSGRITSCDRLVVEGRVEADLSETRAIEISPDGFFKGNAEIDQAEIAGRFEGTITVRQRLFIRSTGKVVGTIRYGTVEIEAGGEIAGDVQVSGG